MGTRIFFLRALVLIACSAGGSAAGQAYPGPRLDGTFIQLLREHGSWTRGQWVQLFDWLRSAGIHRLVIQWTVFDDSAFYPSSAWQPIQNPPLETLLTLADSSHMSVLVGLNYDDAYWSNIQGDAASVTSYLKSLKNRSLTTAKELVPIIRRHPCVTGWYIPEEIDDINWRDPDMRELLFDQVSGLASDLRSLDPRMDLAISGFSQAQSSPEGFRQFWDDLLQRAPVTTVLFQDGVGVNKLDVGEVPIYADALRQAARKNDRNLQLVVELFQQVAGPPIDDSPFRAVPAPLDRIRSQLEIAAQYSEGEIIGFSVPEYMTPLEGEAGRALLSQYRTLFSGSADPNSAR